MNPDTNKFEELREPTKDDTFYSRLLRPDGSPVPSHWSIFSVGDHVIVNNYSFKVAHIGEQHLLLEPAGPLIIGEERENK